MGRERSTSVFAQNERKAWKHLLEGQNFGIGYEKKVIKNHSGLGRDHLRDYTLEELTRIINRRE